MGVGIIVAASFVLGTANDYGSDQVSYVLLTVIIHELSRIRVTRLMELYEGVS
jgi:hypothetical protein